MAEETKKTPQTPEEIAREAQAQAMKAALEQAQALYGNIPGFEGTDLMKMHEKLMQDSAEMFPGVAEAQAYQAKMMAESAQDPEAIMETYSKNIEFAGNMMQQAMNAGFMPEGLPDFSDGFDVYAGWEITRKGDNSLTPEQNKLLAYGAPLFLYNDDNVEYARRSDIPSPRTTSLPESRWRTAGSCFTSSPVKSTISIPTSTGFTERKADFSPDT